VAGQQLRVFGPHPASLELVDEIDRLGVPLRFRIRCPILQQDIEILDRCEAPLVTVAGPDTPGLLFGRFTVTEDAELEPSGRVQWSTHGRLPGRFKVTANRLR
jgi:hypothetical protein